nr:hypothetical protein [Mangrovicoccus ximenensis]
MRLSDLICPIPFILGAAVPLLPASASAMDREACAALAGTSHSGVAVAAADWVGVPGAEGCAVNGTRAPFYDVELFLPALWSERLLVQGGAGFDGSIQSAASAPGIARAARGDFAARAQVAQRLAQDIAVHAELFGKLAFRRQRPLLRQAADLRCQAVAAVFRRARVFHAVCPPSCGCVAVLFRGRMNRMRRMATTETAVCF